MNCGTAAAARLTRAAWIIAALISPAVASAQYEAPTTYYSGATGAGSTLKSQLRTIMTNGHTINSYAQARDYLPITDANPANLTQMFLIYSADGTTRQTVQKSSATAQGFVGAYASREHTWPDSRQTGASADDIAMLKPSDATGGLNNQRGNFFYGGATLTGGARLATSNTFFAGDPDKGDAARICLYQSTRYGYALLNASTDNAANNTMGDLNALMHWHYLDTPDLFEQRRNDVIFRGDDVRTSGDDIGGWNGTGNRNAFIDRPEYAWSVFVDQANDTKLSLGTAAADGGSTATVNLGRVLRGGTAGTRAITLSKAGVDGTYYSVTAGGAATSSVTGRLNAFAMDTSGATSITVGLNASTATAGLKTGTVTIDNLDVTTQGGTGVGANDGNDVANLALSVLDVSNSSFAGTGDADSLSLSFGTVRQGDAAAAQSFSITNLASALGLDLTAGLDLDSIAAVGGSSTKFTTTLAAFKALAAGDSRAFAAMFDTSSIGAFGATYALSFSDEDLPGTQSSTSLTLTLSGTVVAVPEPASLLTFALVGGTLLRRRRRRGVAA